MSHSHAGHHTPDVDWTQRRRLLERSAAAWAHVDAECARYCSALATTTRAADIGAGAGGMTVALAWALGEDGIVYAVDREPELLDLVRKRADREGVGPRVVQVHADLDTAGDWLPEPVGLVWAAHVLHHVGDQRAGLARLHGLLRSDGLLALAEGGLPTRTLPWDLGAGRPGAEVRLEAAHNEWFAAMRDSLPGSVPEPHGWSRVLTDEGFAEVTSRSWLHEQPAPLPPDAVDDVLARLATQAGDARDWLDADDRELWDRLLDPADGHWLGHRDDLFRLSCRTVFFGWRGRTARP